MKNNHLTPANEEKRLKALEAYGIMDTPPEERFDRLTKLASVICEAPIALISLLDANRQWFKSSVGLDVKETPRNISFCQHAIMDTKTFMVEDATKDKRFKDNPLVTGNPDIRFYAGTPLVDGSGCALGTLCVIDSNPKKLNEKQLLALETLAAEVMDQIQLQKKQKELSEYKKLFDLSLDMICIAGTDGFFKKVNPAFTETLGWKAEELLQKSFFEFVHPDDIEKTKKEIEKLAKGERTINFKHKFKTNSGEYRLLNWVANTTETGELYATARDITKSRKLEKELRNSLADKIILQNALDETAMVVVTDAQGLIKRVNKKYCEISKYSEKELMGQHHNLLDSGYHSEAFKEKLWATISAGKIWKGIIKHRAKDGSYFWVDSIIFPIIDEKTNKPKEYLSIRQNITLLMNQQMELEEKKQEVNNRMSAINRSNATIEFTTDGTIITANKLFCDLFGYKIGELRGKHHSILLEPGQAKTAEYKKFWENLAKGEFIQGQFKRIANDGSEKWIFGNYNPIRGIDGTVKSVLKIASDITEMVHAETALQASLSEISQLKDAIDETAIVAVTDAQGKIKKVNKKFLEISKYSEDELIGQDHRILNSGYHEKEFFVDLWKTIASGKVWKGIVRNKAKDNTRYWVDTTIVPFKNEKGKIQEYIAIRQDISEMKETQLLLEQKNKELDQFAYVVSHDLKAPLRAISTLSTFIQEDMGDKMDEESKKNFDLIINRAERLNTLITEILNYSKIGRIEIAPEEVDVRELLIEIIDSLKTNHTAQITLDATFPVLMIQRVFLTQIFSNLISNAIKYGRKEGGTIHIGCIHNHYMLVFYVKDNGIGIDPQFHEKIFQIFQTVEKSENPDSTGVGLSTVKKITEEIGGKIWIESMPGEGSTFFVELGNHLVINKVKVK